VTKGFVPLPNGVRDAAGPWWVYPVASWPGDDRVYLGAISSAGEILACSLDQATHQVARVVVGSTAPDDHNVPALWVRPGRRSVIAWQRHGQDDFLRVRVSARSGGIRTWGPEIHVAGWDNVSYCQLHHAAARSTETADVFLVLARTTLTVWSARWLTIDQVTGGFTASPARPLISDAGQSYVTTAPADGRVRLAAYGHPTNSSDHDIVYGELDLTTGHLLDEAGAVLGCVDTGAGLPVPRSALTRVHKSAAGMSTRLFAVRGGPAAPAVAFATWAETDLVGTYRHAEQAAARQPWAVSSFGDPGQPVGYAAGIKYVAGMAYPQPSRGDVLHVARETAGTWRLEEWDRAGGGSWSSAVLAEAETKKLWRPQPVVGGGPFSTAFFTLTRYASYTDFACDAVFAPRP
jgi:hypothetical protein